MLETVLLVCPDCKRKNYATAKNKKQNPDKLGLRKYCKWCKKHTIHKETKA